MNDHLRIFLQNAIWRTLSTTLNSGYSVLRINAPKTLITGERTLRDSDTDSVGTEKLERALSITHKFWIALVSIPRGLRRVGCAENQVGFRSNSARHSPRWCGLSALSVCGVRKPGVVTPGWNGAGPVAR
jgi:hypothetical protein